MPTLRRRSRLQNLHAAQVFSAPPPPPSSDLTPLERQQLDGVLTVSEIFEVKVFLETMDSKPDDDLIETPAGALTADTWERLEGLLMDVNPTSRDAVYDMVRCRQTTHDIEGLISAISPPYAPPDPSPAYVADRTVFTSRRRSSEETPEPLDNPPTRIPLTSSSLLSVLSAAQTRPDTAPPPSRASSIDPEPAIFPLTKREKQVIAYEKAKGVLKDSLRNKQEWEGQAEAEHKLNLAAVEASTAHERKGFTAEPTGNSHHKRSSPKRQPPTSYLGLGQNLRSMNNGFRNTLCAPMVDEEESESDQERRLLREDAEMDSMDWTT